jgi:hypothetical protein
MRVRLSPRIIDRRPWFKIADRFLRARSRSDDPDRINPLDTRTWFWSSNTYPMVDTITHRAIWSCRPISRSTPQILSSPSFLRRSHGGARLPRGGAQVAGAHRLADTRSYPTIHWHYTTRGWRRTCIGNTYRRSRRIDAGPRRGADERVFPAPASPSYPRYFYR